MACLFLIRFCELDYTLSHKAGSMGKKNADEMLFWTKDEFSQCVRRSKSAT